MASPPSPPPQNLPPTDVGTKLTVLVAIFWAMAIIATGFRLWARLIKRQRLVFNDYACIIALIFTSGLAVSNFLAVVYGGVGEHLLSLPPSKPLFTVKIYVFVWLWQALANTFVRLSFIDLLRRIFKGRGFNIAAWIVFGCSVAYGAACTIALFVECRPFAATYDPAVKGTCGNSQLRFTLSAIFNFLLDLAIIILPMPMLWGLQMATNRKLALTAVFMTGAVVCVMTLLRLQASLAFSNPAAKKDFTVTVFYDALWSSLEPSLGVVNCCLPLFPPVFKKFSDYSIIQSVFSTFSRRSSGKSGASDSYGVSKQSPSTYGSSRGMRSQPGRPVGVPLNNVIASDGRCTCNKIRVQAMKPSFSDDRIHITNDWQLHSEELPEPMM